MPITAGEIHGRGSAQDSRCQSDSCICPSFLRWLPCSFHGLRVASQFQMCNLVAGAAGVDISNEKDLEIKGFRASELGRDFLEASVKTILNIYDQTKAIAEIYSQNSCLEGRVRVVRVGRAKKDAGKQYDPLHIGIAEPEQENHLVDQRLILGSILHNCEPFLKYCRVTQRIQYQRYRHIAKHCTNVLQYGIVCSLRALL